MGKFDALFKTQRTDDWMQGDIEHIGIMTGRDCPSGIMAFGYPFSISDCRPYDAFDAEHHGYDFYSTSLVIELEDIPALIVELERRGFWLTHMRNCAETRQRGIALNCNEDGDEHDYRATRSLSFTSKAAENRRIGVFRKDNGERVTIE